MFQNLSDSLQKVFRDLRGYGRLTEKNVADALREVRLALLEADVNYRVAKTFIQRVREQCMGEEVLHSVTPGQQVVKRVQDEMTRLLGGQQASFDFSDRPSGVLLLGLHGAGKTTTAGKLAVRWKGEGRKVLLAACDIRRPAAVEQLVSLGEQTGVDVATPDKGEGVPAVAGKALALARENDCDVVLYDTGGRFQMDQDMLEELRSVRQAVQPANVVLVLDAAMGQESVDVALGFHEALGLSGLILTKLDGDARGGAALSVVEVTGCPVLLAGTGEGMNDLEAFVPERMAARILGMGDVVGLVERAEASFDRQSQERMEERLKKNRFDLEDFLEQLQQLKRLGPMENLLEMLPGDANVPQALRQNLDGRSEEEWKRAEAIILSMTPLERRKPERIDGSRRKRIARGSGTEVRQVNDLLKRFSQARKMARRMKKQQKTLRRFMK